MSDIRRNSISDLRSTQVNTETKQGLQRSKSESNLQRMLPSQGDKTSEKMLAPKTEDLASKSFVQPGKGNFVVGRNPGQQTEQKHEVSAGQRPRANDIRSTDLDKRSSVTNSRDFQEIRSSVEQLGDQIAGLGKTAGKQKDDTSVGGEQKIPTGTKSEASTKKEILGKQIELSGKIEAKLLDIESQLARNPGDKGLQDDRHALLKLAVQTRFPFLENAGETGAKRLDSAAHTLAEMRDRLPEGSPVRAAVTGSLLTEIARVPSLAGDIGKADPKDQKGLAVAVDVLLGAIKDGNTSVAWRQAGIGRDGEVKQLLSELRKANFQDQAAVAFLKQEIASTGTQTGGDTKVSERMTQLLRDKPDAGTIREFVKSELGNNALNDFDSRMKLAGDAAGRRDQIEEQMGRLQRSLGGGEKGQLGLHSTLFAMSNVLTGGSDTITTTDKVSIDLLRDLGKTNKDASFQVVKLARLLEQAANDHETLGIPNHEANFGATSKFSSTAILVVANLDVKEMVSLGYQPGEAGQLKELADKLANSGFKNPTDVIKHASSIGSIGSKVFNDISNQSGLSKIILKDNALLTKQFENEMLADAEKAVAKLQKPGSKPPTQQEAMSQTIGLIQVKLVGVPGETGHAERLEVLKRAGDLSSEVLNKRIALEGDRKQLQEDVASAQKILVDARGKDGGEVGSRKPPGYDSAKLVLKALDAQNVLDTMVGDHPLRAKYEKTRDEALKDLRGLDLTTLQRPTGDRIKAFFAGDKPPTIDDIKGLRSLADSIIFLRKTAPDLEKTFNSRAYAIDSLEGLDDLSRDSSLMGGFTSDILRREDLAPQSIDGARNIIRLAIAKEMPEGVESFEPLGKRAEIEERLKSMGMDPTLFKPELDQELMTTVDNETLQRWYNERKEGTGLDEAAGTDPEFLEKFATVMKDLPNMIKTGFVEHFTNRRELETKQRELIFDLFSKMQPGESLDLRQGGAIDGKWKVKLDPAALTSVTARIGGSWLRDMTIERTETGFVVTGVKGGQGRLGLELDATIKAGKVGENGKLTDFRLGDNSFSGSVGGNVALRGELHGAKGGSVHFEGENALQNLQNLLIAAMNDSPVSLRLMESVDEVHTVRQIGGSGEVEGKLGVKIGMREDSLGDNGGGVGVEFKAMGGIGGDREIVESLDTRSVETSWTKKLSLGLTVAWFADPKGVTSTIQQGVENSETAKRLGEDIDKVQQNVTGKAPEKPFEVDELTKKGLKSLTDLLTGEIVGLNMEIECESTTKKIFELQGSEGDEHFLGAERSFGINVDSPKIGGGIASLCNENALKQLAGDQKLLGDMIELIKLAKEGKGDQVVMDYKLDPKSRQQASDLIDEATELRRQASNETNKETVKALKSLATNLEDQANGIIGNDENYVPTALRLVRATDESGQKSVLPFGVVSYSHEFGVKEEKFLKVVNF